MADFAVSTQAALWGLIAVCMGAPAQAQSRDTPSGHGTIYRCDSGGSPAYSDVQPRCTGGEVALPRARAASGVQSSGPTARVSLSGPPCPLPVPEPEGPIWNSVRACYVDALSHQPSQRISEAHLAGVLLGQCEAATQKLAQARSFVSELGNTNDARRLAIRRWAQWLVQQSGQATDTMPVQVVSLGKAATIARLSGPIELQLTSGDLVEGFNGSVVQPGQQIHLRKNTSLQLGGLAVAAQGRDRCVRLD